MKLPSVANISGGIAGLLTWVIADIILPHFGIILPTEMQGVIAMAVNVAVTHVCEKVPSVASVDQKIKDIGSELPQTFAEYPDHKGLR